MFMSSAALGLGHRILKHNWKIEEGFPRYAGPQSGGCTLISCAFGVAAVHMNCVL